MSYTLRGRVIDAGGQGVGDCRIVAHFLQRAESGRRVGGAIPPDADGDLLSTDDGTRPVDRRATATALMEMIDVPGQAAAETSANGRFALTFPPASSIVGDIAVTVSSSAGTSLATERYDTSIDTEITITVVPPPPVGVPVAAEPPKTSRRIVGLVVDVDGRRTAANLQVILYGAEGDDAQPVGVTNTDSRGNFTADWPNRVFESATARVATVEELVPIPLDAGRLPTPMLLVVDLPEPSTTDKSECVCADGSVPRTPDSTELATSSDYSVDLGVGGCIRFNVPNRSIEEFDFYSVVRTTEPAIRGVTLGGTASPTPAHNSRRRGALNRIRQLLRSGYPADPYEIEEILANAGFDIEAVREMAGGEISGDTIGTLIRSGELSDVDPVDLPRQAGRATLDAINPVDWDNTPTFYEAATIAHGHLLHFKQVWYADGYSLGDLLYSLPLAPGQKKLIAVVDWERRERATRDDETVASESVLARLSRDRDLSEVVSGALSESIRGGSRSTTAGIGAGAGGAGNGSYYGMNFGALMGVSGGYGEGNSAAWQESAKTIGTSSLQSLRDLTLQSASAVRGQRTSVITTATQGETVRATTEVVANHNHCHAMTMQYFEVLRHLKIVQDVVDVQECLFVPLPMTPFDLPKVLRWRQSIDSYLLRPELHPALDSTRRVQTNWADSQTPAGRYADELVTAIRGELTLTLLVPLPTIPVVPPTVTDPAKIAEIMAPTSGWFGAALAVATGGISLLVGGIAQQTAAGVGAMTETIGKLPTELERYERFQHDVMPGLAAGFVDGLELSAQVGSMMVKLSGADFTLVSDYRPGTPMLVSVRGIVTNPVVRSLIDNLVISSKNGLPDGCRAIVNSAAMRYRTSSFEHTLVFDDRVNDDIDLPTVNTTKFPPVQSPIPGRGVLLYAPTDQWEQLNPRAEDRRLAAELLEHLDANLEHYHHAIWWTMDPNRRYMLLDGYVAPRAAGRSVASVVDNNLLGIVGNALVLPVARGNHLDPGFVPEVDGEPLDLLAHYAPSTPIPPTRVSLPTRGVFAEAVMGECNACEQIDDTRLWRWDVATVDEPTAIEALSTNTRRSEPLDTKPTALPTPIVSIQNAPVVPDPAGVGAIAGVLGQPFADAMGLAGTQANAAAAYQQALSTAAQFGKEASTLAQQAAMLNSLDKSMDAIDKAEKAKQITPEDARSLRMSALQKAVGDGAAKGLRSAETTEKLQTIKGAVGDAGITTADAREFSRRVIGELSGEGTATGDAVARLLEQVDPEMLQSVERSEGGETTSVQLAADRTAPTDISGLSGLGTASSDGTTATRTLIDRAKSAFDAVITGIANLTDNPGTEINDAIKQALLDAAVDAADRATDNLPLVKAFKIAVKLELAFVDGVGAAVQTRGDALRRSYRRGETAGMGSDGYTSDEDYAATRDLRAWQANNVAELNRVLLAGVDAMVELAIKLGADWVASTAADALGDMAKKLITGWAQSSAGGALLKEAIEAVGAGIPGARANVEREAFNTVLRWLIRQLDDPSLRTRLAPLAKLGTNKPLEKELLAAVASMLVDPYIKAAKKEVKDRLIASGHELLVGVKGAGVIVRAGTGPSVAGDATSVTLPAEVLASLEAGVAVETSSIDSVEFEKIRQLGAAWKAARVVAVASGRASQRRLVAMERDADYETYVDAWIVYAGRIDAMLRSLFEVARTMVTGSLAMDHLTLPRLNRLNPRVWEGVEIYSDGPGQPAKFRVVRTGQASPWPSGDPPTDPTEVWA